jgi:hypothetical protein
VANAILPTEDPLSCDVEGADPETCHEGIQEIDRTTVTSIGEISASYQSIQTQLDEADRGLNPLGLAKGVVPFDIDPSLIDAGKTHFEQIWDRAVQALGNAVRVFDFANETANRLRENQDKADDFNRNLAQSERNFTNQLIELFGTPFSDDIGPGRTYPSGYTGPDIYHYMILDRSALEGRPVEPEVRDVQAVFDPIEATGFLNENVDENDVPGGLPDMTQGFLVEYKINEDDFLVEKPSEWVGRRSAPGELQDKLSDLLIAQNRFEQALRIYDNRLADIEQQTDETLKDLAFLQKELDILDQKQATAFRLTTSINALKTAQTFHKRVAALIEKKGSSVAECLPKSIIVGTSSGGDTTSTFRCTIEQQSLGIADVFESASDLADVAQLALEQAKEHLGEQADLDIKHANFNMTVLPSAQKLRVLMRGEPELRANAHEAGEVVRKAADAFQRTLARAERVLTERTAFRTGSAGDVGERRYRDAAFRIFRNEAIQKYRSSFDLASRYAFLAATAYDYETNLLGGAAGAGQRFLTDIVKERHLGSIDFLRNVPESGYRGLANVLARLGENFAVLKGRLGFNNPQTETNRFSLRRELLRLGSSDSDEAWRTALESYRVDNLWEVEAFRRYARPFSPPPTDPRSQPQPGFVIPFSTTVEAGLNFFGEPLQAGDSAYDATNFATKVRSVGVWLENYDCTQLSNTPRVYLLPTGADVLRPPTAGRFDTRSWQVVDQALPVPFQIGASDLYDDAWIPRADSLSEPFGEIRRFSSFRAYSLARDGATPFNAQQTTTDSRLIGRSVWNSNWVLIIPGRNLLFDPDEALERFIPPQDGEVRPAPAGCQTVGVSDIQLFFQTYAISGN